MMKQLQFATAALLMLAVGASFAAGKGGNDSKTAAPLNLTIYHIEGRRSERIVWLCEELGLPSWLNPARLSN
jgi:glutathione S-transferase